MHVIHPTDEFQALSEKTANVTARKVPTGRQRGEEVKSKIGCASFLSFVIASLAPEVVLRQLLVRLSALILRGAMCVETPEHPSQKTHPLWDISYRLDSGLIRYITAATLEFHGVMTVFI